MQEQRKVIKMLKQIVIIILVFVCNLSYSQKIDFPYELKLKRELLFTGIGLGSLTLYELEKSSKSTLSKSYISNLNANKVNKFDRRTINNWDPDKNKLRESFEPVICMAAATGTAIAGLKFNSHESTIKKITTLGAMYAEGFLLTYGLKKCSKIYIDRNRPYLYNPSVPIEEKMKSDNNQSFYSGNAAIMFYNTAFISKVYGDLFPNSKFKYVIMGLGLSWSTYSGWLSVKSGKHYMTDVIAGALIGAATGYLIPKLHLRKSINKSNNFNINISPTLLKNSRPGLIVKLLH